MNRDERDYLADLRRRQLSSWPPDVPTAPTYPLGEQTLSESLRGWARTQPERVAVVYYGTELTYAAFDAAVDSIGGHLVGAGVRPGDRIAVMLPNCPQFLIAFHAILRIGAVHVPVSPMSKEAEIIHELDESGADVLIAWDALLPAVEEVRAKSPLRHVIVTSLSSYLPDSPTLPVPDLVRTPVTAPPPGMVGWDDALTASAPDQLPTVGLDDLAALNFTGGTTGLPKGCEHTHRHMVYTAACLTSAWKLGHGERSGTALVFLPAFWIAGEVLAAILPVFVGGTCVLLARWSPDAVLTGVERYRVTELAGTVDSYLDLMDHPDVGEHDLSSLATTVAASFVHRLTIEVRQRWREVSGSTAVLREAAYGMTETHTFDTFVTGLNDGDQDLHSRPVFCGLPMPGTEFKIVDFETRTLCALGAEGEICVRSPAVMRGYWNADDDDHDGWLATGDIGMIDEHGFLHFLGRRKEMLKVNGMSVFPAEIEAVLGGHPDVVGCGVVGTSNPRSGERPVAFVEITPIAAGTIDAEALRQWCAERLADYKVPEVRISAELPRTASGKIRKNLLVL
ncbi:fatty-acyl-CoA synthase [Kribbella sp. VKM Ac-2527]|uniref:Fatty-acyl-CoA synthase n=1 Tax=Kribbella caucasensis TaxID=2512215 RepID=A0A4R6KHN2_9ACTN|nr:AMP-binding protein [Kribbella sp. VKM Ac-2527]TDO50533.1 fatty-acyl-CoA synthase [Kribbella sp. VKM Ac-2527]